MDESSESSSNNIKKNLNALPVNINNSELQNIIKDKENEIKNELLEKINLLESELSKCKEQNFALSESIKKIKN